MQIKTISKYQQNTPSDFIKPYSDIYKIILIYMQMVILFRF